jgi:prolyl-tRNA editing enzyme YbaK/EbsC (Cys-tRNA(Pro) deacylase)
MKPATHPSALRTASLLVAAGLPNSTVVEFEQPTRSSEEAATAIGCSVAEIAKTVVFRGQKSGQAVVVVASGANRVSERKVAELLGETLGRASPEFVRSSTGYVIGGVAPIGHINPVLMVLDQDLLQFTRIWAAAGTPFSVFPITPQELQALTAAQWADVRA